MKKLYISQIFFIIIIGLSSCNTFTNLKVKYDRKLDFEKYKTYAWLPDVDKSGNNDFDNDLIRQRIRNYVGHCLDERQYEIDTLNPDLLVRVKWMTHAREIIYPYVTDYPFYYDGVYYEDSFAYKLATRSNYYNTGGYSISGEKARYYHSGLEVVLIDTKTNKVIWNGITTADIYDREVLDKELHPSVHRMMNRLPPRTNEVSKQSNKRGTQN